jgi:hypothetical protein
MAELVFSLFVGYRPSGRKTVCIGQRGPGDLDFELGLRQKISEGRSNFDGSGSPGAWSENRLHQRLSQRSSGP